jgi:hypothetical protein
MTTSINHHTARQTSRPKVRLATQTPKDIANVVGRLHALLKSAVPLVEDSFYDLNSRVEEVLNGDMETILMEDDEVLVRANPWRRPVKVGP